MKEALKEAGLIPNLLYREHCWCLGYLFSDEPMIQELSVRFVSRRSCQISDKVVVLLVTFGKPTIPSRPIINGIPRPAGQREDDLRQRSLLKG